MIRDVLEKFLDSYMLGITSIFNSDEGKDFFIDHSNILWLHGTLLCNRLGFANPNQAIVMHTEEDERQQVDTGKLGKKPWFVNEYGVWGMILASRTPEAKEFKRFLKYEVLPSIRRDGGYISSTATPEQLENLQEKIKLQLSAIEQSFDICKASGDDRGIITLKSQLVNLTNKMDGNEDNAERIEWLSISEILSRKGYNLHNKKVNDSLSQVGKNVKREYKKQTGLDVKTTPKHLGTGHHADSIVVYPEHWFDAVEDITIQYWNQVRFDKKNNNEEYNLLTLATNK